MVLPLRFLARREVPTRSDWRISHTLRVAVSVVSFTNVFSALSDLGSL